MDLDLALLFQNFGDVDEAVMFGHFQKIYYLLDHLIFLFGVVDQCLFDESFSIFGQCLSQLAERIGVGHFNDELFWHSDE